MQLKKIQQLPQLNQLYIQNEEARHKLRAIQAYNYLK